MQRLYILTVVSVCLSVIIFCTKQRTPVTIATGEGLLIPKEWLKTNPHPQTPSKDIRLPDQTFLTYPEWYLVFSPEEQAAYFKNHTATGFPYTSHTQQLWNGYDIICYQVKEAYPYNGGYHFMIWVIGGSTTAEYGIKSLYETLIGRLTDTRIVATDEDRFNTTYMNEYVTFIKDLPWYEFDYNSQLKKLYTETSFTGSNFIRKAERRYFLTTELLVKSAYGWLIKKGTKSIYDEAALSTTVVVTGFNDSLLNGHAEIKLISKNADGSAMLSLPRYDNFSKAAAYLAGKGLAFREVAGNTAAILITVWRNAGSKTLLPGVQQLFVQPIVSNPSWERVAFVTPVGNLHHVLNELMQQEVKTEHVYDY